MAKRKSQESTPRDKVVHAIEISAASAVLVGLAYKFLKHKEDAEDAAQTALEKALRAANNGQFRGDSQPLTWLHRITVNSALDQGRSNQRQQMAASKAAEQFDYQGEDTFTGPEEALMHSESLRRVAESMEDLSEIQKEILVRFVFLEQSHDEIAKALDIPIGTSKSYLHRALNKVK